MSAAAPETLEKIRAKRTELEEIAAGDGPLAEIAQELLDALDEEG